MSRVTCPGGEGVEPLCKLGSSLPLPCNLGSNLILEYLIYFNLIVPYQHKTKWFSNKRVSQDYSTLHCNPKLDIYFRTLPGPHKDHKSLPGKCCFADGWSIVAHDICVDYVDHGVGTTSFLSSEKCLSLNERRLDVTMFQRSSTYIISAAKGVRMLLEGMQSFLPSTSHHDS